MSEMPERIWATDELRRWYRSNIGGDTEYVRADIVDAKDAEIERLVVVSGKREALLNQQKAEIERLRARNEFLEKVADQAIELGQLKLSEQDAGSTPGFVLCDACMDDVPIEKAPELDAYLRERNNRPPNSGVQSGVQHPEEGGKSA